MAKNLVIVESPAKAKTINKLLGGEYVVKASMGHVRDLPERSLGVDVEKGFAPQYVPIKGRAKILSELQAIAAKSEKIFLAPDPDREGEAIAWHLREALKAKSPLEKFCRVTYNEITAPAIRKAFEDAGITEENAGTVLPGLLAAGALVVEFPDTGNPDDPWMKDIDDPDHLDFASDVMTDLADLAEEDFDGD